MSADPIKIGATAILGAVAKVAQATGDVAVTTSLAAACAAVMSVWSDAAFELWIQGIRDGRSQLIAQLDDPLDKGPLDHGRSSDINGEVSS